MPSTIPWRLVAKRAGRNELPTILFHYWERLSAEDKPKALSAAWTMPEYPERHAEPDAWVAVFDDVGYMVDGQVMDRAEDPDLPEVVTLWRGCIPGRRNGMSWTTNRELAQWFATRWNGYQTEQGVVYRIEIPNEYVLARLSTRGEEEVVVDTTVLDDEEYLLLEDGESAQTHPQSVSTAESSVTGDSDGKQGSPPA